MKQSNLEFRLAWGWNDFFEKQLTDSDQFIGRVVGEEKDRWRVQVSAAEAVWAELPGKYRYQSHSRMDLPSVGDWISCKYEEHQSVALVQKVFARKSCMYRKAVGGGGAAQILASNIDFAFILTSANADMNVARLERYVSLAWDSGAIPILCVTKAELSENLEELLEALQAEFPGVGVHALSVKEKIGLQSLEPYIAPGKAVVFVGSSGVGKSTLTNHLLGEDVLQTQEIRESDDRGKHTTTARYLFPTDNGALVIDTPGMRLLPLMDQEDGVETLFSDLAEIENACRFGDCQHLTEPGCAVLSALEDGVLDENRWNRYQKLQRELQRKQINEDRVKQRQAREKLKKQQKEMYEHIKMKRR